MSSVTIKMNNAVRQALRTYTQAVQAQVVRYTCDDPTGFWGEDVERAVEAAKKELHLAIAAQVPGRTPLMDIDATVQGFLRQVEKTGIAYQLVVLTDGDS